MLYLLIKSKSKRVGPQILTSLPPISTQNCIEVITMMQCVYHLLFIAMSYFYYYSMLLSLFIILYLFGYLNPSLQVFLVFKYCGGCFLWMVLSLVDLIFLIYYTPESWFMDEPWFMICYKIIVRLYYCSS